MGFFFFLRQGVLCQDRENPCKNAGKYEIEEGSSKFRCFCSAGFTGEFCEKKCKKVEKKVDVVFVVDGSYSLFNRGQSTNPPCDDTLNSRKFNQELEFVDEVSVSSGNQMSKP